jgi:hypothetical protein
MTFIVDGTNGLTFNNSTTQASAGVVLQVVNATTNTQVTTSSSTYADTTLTATITPKFATSKILVLVSQNGVAKYTNDLTVRIKLLRNSTDLIQLAGQAAYTQTGLYLDIGSVSGDYLDSPATTSATTYKTQFAAFSGVATAVVQNSQLLATTSTITLMEIAG